MINFINTLISHFKLIHIRKIIKNMDKMYFATVDNHWQKLGYSKTTTLFPKDVLKMNHDCKVSVLQGIDLALANNCTERCIFLSDIPQSVKSLIKHYVRLRGFSDSFVKSYDDFKIEHVVQTGDGLNALMF